MTSNVLTLEAGAFIPGLGLGGSVRLTKGPYAGRHAVPLPGEGQASMPHRAAFNKIGYLADDRGPSLDPSRTSRMTFVARIDLDRGQLVGTPVHNSSLTTEVDIETGEELRVAISSTELRQTGTLKTRNGPDGSVTHEVWFRAIGHDPLVWASALTPIRLVGTFSVTVGPVGRVTVAIDSRVTPYPAFEALARYEGQSAFVATRAVEEKATVSWLFDGGRYLRHLVTSNTLPSCRMEGSVTFRCTPARNFRAPTRYREGV